MRINLWIFFLLEILQLARSFDYITIPEIEVYTYPDMVKLQNSGVQIQDISGNFNTQFTNVPQLLITLIQLDSGFFQSTQVNFEVDIKTVSQTQYSITFKKNCAALFQGFIFQLLAINNKDSYVVSGAFAFNQNKQQSLDLTQMIAKQTFSYQRNNFDANVWNVKVYVFIRGFDKTVINQTNDAYTSIQTNVEYSTNSFTIVFKTNDLHTENKLNYIYYNYIEFYQQNNNQYYNIQGYLENSINPPPPGSPLTQTEQKSKYNHMSPLNVQINTLKGILFGLTSFDFDYKSDMRLSVGQPDLNQNQFQITYSTWDITTVLHAQINIIVFAKINCNKNQTLFLDDFNKCTSQCPIGYYKTTVSDFNNGPLDYCKKCDPSCLDCSGTSTQCLSCNPGTFLYSDTCYNVCPNGYQSNQNTWNCDACRDYRFKSCFSCDKTCLQCNPAQALANICTKCYEITRKLNSNTKICECQNSKDTRTNFYHCSFQDIAVIDAILSGTLPQLEIDFGSLISMIPNPNTSQSVCEYIFNKSMFDQNKIGYNSTCIIQGNKVIVKLDNISTIMEGDQIVFQPSTLKFVDYTVSITQFFTNIVTQSPYGDVQVNFLHDSIQNSCNPLKIQFNNIVGDAGRLFYNQSWSLVSITGSQSNDQLLAINQVIQQANQINNTSLTISPNLLPPNQNITIQFAYKLKVSYSNQLTFYIFYQKQKIIRISYQQSIYPPIYRYMSLSFYFQFFTEICDYGKVKLIYEPVNLQVVSPGLQQIQQSQMSYNQSNFEVDIPSYTLPSNQKFTFNFQLSLSSDNTIQTAQIVNVDLQITDLFVLLSGGHDQIASYQKQFTQNSTSRDYEIQDSTADQMITYNWICKNIVINDICKDYQGNPINIQQSYSSVSISAKSFKPYTIINLTLQVSKDTRQSSDFTFCYFSELDIPPLFVKTPIEQVKQQFNINEDLLFTLVYDSSISSNILSYAGALLYDNSVVAAIKFDYYQVKFRIWDYFQNISPSQPNIQVRFSVYNPSYVMPSISTIDLLLNIPPQNCVLTVTPQQGIALQTIFLIQFSSCTDVDAPITYQFFYYNSIDDYNQEIIAPWNIVRRQLNDKTVNNSFRTILPQGNLLILSQALDSRLGISNSTLSIQVQSQDLLQQSYYEYANTLIQQNMQTQQTTNNLIVNLCIIGEDISKMNQFSGSQQINNLKQNLINNLQQQSQQLTKFSLASTYANKIVSQLQQSIFQQPDLQKSSIFNQIQQIVLQTQTSISSNSINKFQQNSNLQTQNLIDSYRILNSTVSLNTNNTFNDLMQYNTISNQIASIISNTMIPNQGELIIQGNLSNILVDSITEKNLHNYVLPDDDSQINLNSTNIYTVTRNTYKQNIYESTPSFQAYLKPNRLSNLQNLNNQSSSFNYSKNQLIETSINNTQTKNPISNSTLIYSFKNATVSSKYNMTCLQQADIKWNNQNCSVLNKGNNNYACLCSKNSPKTLIDDISSLFTQNENLYTAFGEQGLKNLENFDDFYLYVCFWVLLFFTFVQLVLCLFGRYLDFKTMEKTNYNLKYQQDYQQLEEKIQLFEKQLKQEQQSISKQETDSKNQKNFQTTQKIYLHKNKVGLENMQRDSQYQDYQIEFIQLSNNQDDDFNLQQPQKEQLSIQESQSTIKQQTVNNNLFIYNFNNNNQCLKVQYEEQSPQKIHVNQKSFKSDKSKDLQTNQQETSCQISTVQISEKPITEEEQTYIKIGENIIQGNLSTILVDSIIEKSLQNYGLPDDDSQINLNSTKTYTVTRNTFQLNIYLNTSNFQAYFQPLNNQNYNFNYSKNQLVDTSINTTQTKNPISNPSLVYSFKNEIVSSKQNMTSLQQIDVKLNNQHCTVLNKSSQNYDCLCNKSSRTTLVDYISSLSENKNLQTAFGEQGLKNLENQDDFQLNLCFWVLYFFTFTQLILCLL
ncbi:hypothetical protein ABPG72_010507 [Tetrahymena utriculariae]